MNYYCKTEDLILLSSRQIPMQKSNINEIRPAIHKYMRQHRFSSRYFNNFTSDDLYIMYKLYNRYIFKGQIEASLKNPKDLSLVVDNRSTKTAGKYVCTGDKHEIHIASKVLMKTFVGDRNGKLLINGLFVTDRISALQLILEHELVHMYISLQSQKTGKKYPSHGKFFRTLVYDLFGHTDVRHSLLNGDASNNMTKQDCYIGMTVQFTLKNKKVKGKIIKLNPKRAKVQINLNIYSVPYSMIKPCR